MILAKEIQKTLCALRHTAYLQNKQKPKLVVVTLKDFCFLFYHKKLLICFNYMHTFIPVLYSKTMESLKVISKMINDHHSLDRDISPSKSAINARFAQLGP